MQRVFRGLDSELLVPQYSDAGHLNGGAARHEHTYTSPTSAVA
jgi:hypothetical protein